LLTLPQRSHPSLRDWKIGKEDVRTNESEHLKQYAQRIRSGSLLGIYHAGSGHPGGALSAADLLAYLWCRELDYAEGNGQGRKNRFIMSKGHACPALYAAAAEAGVLSREELRTLRKLGSPLQGHPDFLKTPWAETSTGSLGQGFSFAIGLALGLRYRKSDGRVYVMLGDGELQEGQVWEGAMCAAHYRLDNLCAVVDYNKMQSDDLNKNVIGLEPLRAKWEAFNWHVQEIDGHNLEEIERAFTEAKSLRDRPTVIIAHTIKGKGVSYMEGSPLWHGSVKLSDEDFARALQDLGMPAEQVERYKVDSIWKG
jgi:transketolase